ncbi:hypothetical protein BJ912DRAFT_1092378 [Pholiota molesta]|nr:hypothetical protein BJ912DRAFT_1092378 [Pholiota molesta]
MSESQQTNALHTPYKVTTHTPLANYSTSWNTPGTGVSGYYSAAFSPIPSNHSSRATPKNTSGSKRKAWGKENTPAPADRRKRGKITPLTISDKVKLFYGFIKHELDWTFSEALFYASQATADLDFSQTTLDAHDSRFNQWNISRESITATLQHFFNGNVKYPPAKILECWYKHPYGRLERDSPNMYSTDTPYSDLKPVRTALTSFAVQTVLKKLVKEAESAIATLSGLHLSLSNKRHHEKKIEWRDIGALTFEHAQDIITMHQLLLWNLVNTLAARRPRDRSRIVRTKRPPHLVAVNVISTINYSRSSRAKLLPLATALVYFGSKAPFDLFRYRSRIGDMPSYNSVIRSMDALSECEAALTLSHGLDPSTIGVIRLDNVQNYLVQRDTAIGRQNRLNIGLAATYYEIELDGIDISTFDLKNAEDFRTTHSRKTLTLHGLHKLIDNSHIGETCILQWISTLIHYIPSLSFLEPEISVRYRTRVSKQPLKEKPSKVHPLASSSCNESITTDLNAALLDFLEQTGQTSDTFKNRLFPIGGDGLTYEKMVQLKEYLQFHESDLQSMRIVQPLLEWWHTEWTNLSRIFESHWGPALTNDPSRLAHSAAKIGHKKPPNLKKVDFYNSRDFAFLVLDARILDCWRLFYKTDDLFQHFSSLASKKNLPSYEDLEISARQLYHSYTSVRAQERVMRGGRFLAKDTVTPILPNAWATSLDSDPNFAGDQVLARSMAFMRETMMARELSLSTAEGDVGRVWEIIKSMAFTFAGSSHAKYMGYVLEMIATLEIESSEDLRRGLLQMTLVNLTGRAGHWSAGDFVQEYFNRLLEAVVERKGVEYGDKFIRKTWSRNLHHVARLKLSWFDGVGLQERSAKHSEVGRLAELNILLDVYRKTQLHSFQSRRTFDTQLFIDDYQKGAANLANGKLDKWIHKTTHARDLTQSFRERQKETVEPEPSGTDDRRSEAMPMPIMELESESESDSDKVTFPNFIGRPEILHFSNANSGRLTVHSLSEQDILLTANEILERGSESDAESDSDNDYNGGYDSD